MMNLMKISMTAVFILGMTAGCKTMDLDSAFDVGGNAFKAMTFSDQDAREVADQACPYMDSQAKIAPANSKYTRRLNAIAKKLNMPEVNGAQTNYKVYLTKDINAFAMANGCIRVYSGLMDMMTDDEVMGVVGHEIGHVALGHTRKRMQVAYATAAARGAAAASGNSTIVTLNQSQLGELSESLIHAQYSQANESAADDYSFDLLTERRLNTRGLVTAFQKLAALNGGKSDMFSSHPSASDRASRLEARMNTK